MASSYLPLICTSSLQHIRHTRFFNASVSLRTLPLRQFGIIFSLVALLSLLFSLGLFATLLMILGPGGKLALPKKARTVLGRSSSIVSAGKKKRTQARI